MQICFKYCCCGFQIFLNLVIFQMSLLVYSLSFPLFVPLILSDLILLTIFIFVVIPRRLRTPSWKLIESNFVYTKPCFPLIIIKMRTWLKYLTYTCMHKSSLGYYNTPLQLACHYLFICAAFAVFVSLAPYLFSPPNFSHPLPTCVQY